MTDYNFTKYGCHHTACGRVLKNRRTAGLDDPGLDRPHAPIEPVRHVIEGARAYASQRGLTDPHNGDIDYHKVMTHRGLLGELGRAYDRLPLDDPNAHKHFDAMRHEVNHQYHHLTHNMGINVEVKDHDPYRNIHELASDVRNNHRIQVLGTHATGGHPFFTNDENDRFRAVHDVFGHLGTGRDFDAHGEEAAYQAHARMFSHVARPAMASETRGQNGSLILNGSFGPQRIAVLPHRLWTPGLAHNAKLDMQDYYLERELQRMRAEEATGGYHTELNSYFGRDGEGDAVEKPLNFKDYLRRNETSKERESFQAGEDAYKSGREWGQRHMTHPNPASENDDLEWASVRHQNPDRFWEGYQHGLIGKSASMEVYAVLVEGVDDMPKGLRVTAHVSGNSIDVLHCPFCGSGAVIARSDGTIECGYCMSVFTVQVQPQFSGFPQSVDGQPYQWPGMPDPNAVMAPDTPPGTNVNPMVAPDSSDPSAFDGVDGDEDDDDDDGNPFASDSDSDADADSDDGSSKSKPQSKSDDKSDKKSDKKKSDKGNPFGKKSSSLRTAQGAELPVAEFEAHLAIKYAKNPLIVAQRVREGRAGGLL